MSERVALRVKPLLELLRFSLAPSVIADLCAGVALARREPGGGEIVARMAGVSLLLFCGGMALNAWVDREEDRQTRPKRPLPSGAIAPALALGLAILALAGAPALAWVTGGEQRTDAMRWSAAMAGLIVLYHTPLKRSRVLGPLVLGSIRGADLLLGAVAAAGLRAGVSFALPAAIAYAAYVFGASCVAHEEDRHPWMKVVRAGVVVALGAIAANAVLAAGVAPRFEGSDASSQLAFAAAVIAIYHLVTVRSVLQLFKPGAPGLTPLTWYARALLARISLLPAAATIGAGAPDLGGLALLAFLATIVLARVIPPT